LFWSKNRERPRLGRQPALEAGSAWLPSKDGGVFVYAGEENGTNVQFSVGIAASVIH